MTYELALALKNAGFPQQGDYCYVAVDTKGDWTYEKRYIGNIHSALLRRVNIAAYTPTLEELISACGREQTFSEETHYFSLETDSENWWAGYVDNVKSELFAVRQKGSTPTIAVANLWLALNKK